MQRKKKDFLTLNKVYIFFTLLLVTLLISFNAFHYYQPNNTLAPKIFSLGLLLVTLLSGFFFRHLITEMSQQALNLNRFQRAEQALSCIDEVVITTNMYGKIIFCNTSAGKWLGNRSIASVIGKPIQKVFPYPGMPWLDRWSNMKTNGQIENWFFSRVIKTIRYVITFTLKLEYCFWGGLRQAWLNNRCRY